MGQRLAQRERPQGRPAMVQSWRSLTFLHWPVRADQLQRLLPKGLAVDTHEGTAYAGLIPFTMHGVRLTGWPSIPGTERFHETNVRTYVVDERGVPGVWFFSLDAASWLAVQIARAWYRLPYQFATMRLTEGGEEVEYESRRKSGARCSVVARRTADPAEAVPGSLEFFLVERYVLFAQAHGRLYDGRVSHAPYRVAPATCLRLDESLVQAAGIQRPATEPHVLYSPGVDVEVFPLHAINAPTQR